MDEQPEDQPFETLERTLLIVDDDERFRDRLARAMALRDFTVTTAGSVREGLTQVQQAAPDYAVLDYKLGDGTGFDVAAAIRGARADSRIIVLTGYGYMATAAAALKAGADDYLAKPADADTIEAALLSKALPS